MESSDRVPLITAPEGGQGEIPIDVVVQPDEIVDQPSLGDRFKTWLIGRPRDLGDRSIFRHLSLVAFLAWVGLGADGLSSSCYGPAEAFHYLQHSHIVNGVPVDHRYLAVFLSLATVVTVFVISACYSHIIEAFPSGGGGYLVATKLLGRPAGVVSGCALLVDYVLTITVSIAAAGDALFGLLGPNWDLLGFGPPQWKLFAETGAIALLIILNLRGVKESVLALLPIFLLFLLTHAVLIIGSVALNLTSTGKVAGDVAQEVGSSVGNANIGLWGMLLLLLHAYSLGAGTYTGIEAVSNSMPVLREPRVLTGQRTMRYMAYSLAFMAGGLMLAYLLLGISSPSDDPLSDGYGKTMNHLLAEKFTWQVSIDGTWFGTAFVHVCMLSAAGLLCVAAQAGFIGGPQGLANMARDAWAPRWFANLSERLATHNGVLLMGLSALAALWLTGGVVRVLVIMYSINVFLTFSLSMLGMCRHWWAERHENPLWRKRLALFAVGATMCVSILIVTIVFKFHEGGWRTLAVTGACVVISLLIHRHYQKVGERLRKLDEQLTQVLAPKSSTSAEPDPSEPTAVVLVGGYGGLGIHTMMSAWRMVPGHFKNFVFVGVGVIDSGNFKGARAVDDLRRHTQGILTRYVDLARRFGLPATSYLAIGTDVVDELAQICVTVRRQFPKAVFFAGQLVFAKDKWYHRMLHNETAYSLQRRLHWLGVPIMILPTRVQ